MFFKSTIRINCRSTVHKKIDIKDKRKQLVTDEDNEDVGATTKLDKLYGQESKDHLKGNTAPPEEVTRYVHPH